MNRRTLSVALVLPLLMLGIRVAIGHIGSDLVPSNEFLPQNQFAIAGQCPAPEPTGGRVQNQIQLAPGAYLNQRALSPEGDQQCGVASVAMTLALTGRITNDHQSMATTANYLWQSYTKPTSVRVVTDMLNDHGLSTTLSCLPADAAWERLKASVDCGVPAIMASTRLTQSGTGHFIVVVGYAEESSEREIVTYDSFGRWLGPGEGYQLNEKQLESHRGLGEAYSFDDAWGYGSSRCPNGYLLSVQPQIDKRQLASGSNPPS